MINELKPGCFLCMSCFPDELREQISRRINGKLESGTLLVGHEIQSWDRAKGEARQGRVSSKAPGLHGGYIVEWADGGRSTLSEDDTVDACRMAAWLAARDSALEAKRHERERKRAYRSAQQSSAPAAPAPAAPAPVAESPKELSEEEQKWLSNVLSRANTCSTRAIGRLSAQWEVGARATDLPTYGRAAECHGARTEPELRKQSLARER